MNADPDEMAHEIFNKWFDAMFRENCWDSNGHLQYICKGKLGLELVSSYLSGINWDDFPLDIIEIKLWRLLVELEALW